MTTPTENAEIKGAEWKKSLLPFNETDLLALRVLPAEFARMMAVSKQTVSRWIKNDMVTLGADGRLDPTVALRQILKNCDPGRLRSRLVRQAYADMADLRARAAQVEDLEERLAFAKNTIRFLDGFLHELNVAREIEVDVLVAEIELIRSTNGPEALRIVFDELLDRALIMAGEKIKHDDIWADLSSPALLEADRESDVLFARMIEKEGGGAIGIPTTAI